MTITDNPPLRSGQTRDPSVWPVVSPDEIVIAEWDWDLAYMAVYVERVRLKLQYFETGDEATGGPAGPQREPVAEWILDMPRREWNPYELPGPPDAACDPADPLPPGQAYEFTLVHYDGGPRGWVGRRAAVSVEVCELKLRSG